METALAARGWKVDAVLSHTTPLKYVPTEVFLTSIDQRLVDKSTEIWLDSIESRLTYKHWYAGHFHTENIVLWELRRALEEKFPQLDIEIAESSVDPCEYV